MDMAEQFKLLLDEDEVFYKTDSFSDGRKVFRIPQKLKSGAFVEVLVIFYDDSIKIAVLKIASVEDVEKRGEVLRIFNATNRAYKYFKIYLDDDGDVVAESDLVADIIVGEFQPAVLLAYMGAILKTVNDVYPKIMKVLWSD